jgi:ferritin-like metal-binding protein YciE
MSVRDPQETLLSWLNDAYSMEKGLVQVLENHANDVKDHPDAYRKITEHLEKTRLHADRVEQCIARLGGSTSTVKTALGSISGFIQGRTTGASPDEMVKNGLSDYAAEHFEIACYRALIVAARALGQNEIVQICEDILRDEEDMARWLEKQLPMMVQEYLGQGAQASVGAGSAGSTTSGTTRY